MLYTIGFNHYIGYIMPMSVTGGTTLLTQAESTEYCKVIYVKTGASHFLINGKEFVLTGACTICMNEQDQITFYTVNEDAVKILWFKPTLINLKFTHEVLNNAAKRLSLTEAQDTFFLRQFMNSSDENSKILSLHTIDSASIEHKIQLIDELLTNQNTSSWPCRSRSYLFEILFALTRQEEDETPDSNIILREGSSKLAIDVIYYLQSSYNQKITIEKLSELFHTNRTTLLNDFKKYTGQSINRYLIELRLTMASALLRDTELSTDEISERTGFSDISYFSKVFKKNLSYTPSEYRRIYKHDIY